MLYDPNWKPPAKIKLEPWQKILLKAADLIEQNGWVQGNYKNAAGFCVLGAIGHACGYIPIIGEQWDKNPDSLRACAVFSKTVNALSIPRWNDNPIRNKQEVITQLRKAAHAV